MIKAIGRIWNAIRTSRDQNRGFQWLSAPSASGPIVSEDTALACAAVWACVRVISEAISQLPWRVYKMTESGSEPVAMTMEANKRLYYQPNGYQTPAIWREVMLKNALLHGNAYAEIGRDGSNRPSSMVPIHPRRVQIEWVGDETLLYIVHNEDGSRPPRTIEQRDMFHLRGLGNDMMGMSVIQYGANAVGLAIGQEQHMSSLMKNGSRPGGLLTPAGSLTREAALKVREEWQAAYGGATNVGRTALLSHGMSYTPLAIPNEDMELLASRKFSVTEICRLFRVPPHLVYDLDRATFSNIEHQAIEFVQYSLVPWIKKLEEEADAKLISRGMQPYMFTKINVNGLLRGDFQSRATGYQLLMDRGVLSINDVRDLEDMNKVDDGDKRMVPMNMTTLEKLGEEPEPQAAPALATPTEDEDQDNMMDLARPAIRAAGQRILARELAALRKACERGDTERVRTFYAGQRDYIKDQLAPLLGLLKAAGRDLDLDGLAVGMTDACCIKLIWSLENGMDWLELFANWEASRVDSFEEAICGPQAIVQG